MNTLSALDAISPALSRTRRILFAPFRKGRSWKLAATAYVATAGTGFLPFPLFYLAFIPAARRGGGTLLVLALILLALVLTAIVLVVFYLCSRAQFAFLDIVLNQGQFVAPAWKKYGRESLQWVTFKVIFGTVVMALYALPTIAYVRHVIPLFQSIHPGQPPPPEFMSVLFAGYGLIALMFGSFFIVSSLLADFMVPLLIIEGTGLAGAFRSLFRAVRNEPGPYAGYALGKILLSIAGYLAATMAFQVVFLFSILIIGAIAGGFGLLLHFTGVPNLFLIVPGIILGVAVYLFFVVYVLLLAMGTVFTFLQSYTLYFLGGRYPLIGEVLTKTDPPPPTHYGIPVPPPPLQQL